jgi:hypothetical protein
MRKNVCKVVLCVGVFAFFADTVAGGGPAPLPGPNGLGTAKLVAGGGPVPLPGPGDPGPGGGTVAGFRPAS